MKVSVHYTCYYHCPSCHANNAPCQQCITKAQAAAPDPLSLKAAVQSALQQELKDTQVLVTIDVEQPDVEMTEAPSLDSETDDEDLGYSSQMSLDDPPSSQGNQQDSSSGVKLNNHPFEPTTETSSTGCKTEGFDFEELY